MARLTTVKAKQHKLLYASCHIRSLPKQAQVVPGSVEHNLVGFVFDGLINLVGV
jgi:hypothetical protein